MSTEVSVSFYGPSLEAWAGMAWGIAADLLVWAVAFRMGWASSMVVFIGSMLAFFIVAFGVQMLLESHRSERGS